MEKAPSAKKRVAKKAVASKTIKVRSGKALREIKTCTELKSFLKKRINAKVKDATLAKAIEGMFGDLIAYGVGDIPSK